MSYAPIVRIILRYIIGGVFMGSVAIGNQLAADPDLIAMGAMGLAAACEAVYAIAKKKGWAT